MVDTVTFTEMLIITLGWAGVFSPVVLGAIGSMIGCTIGGQAACGALLEVESGYGKFIGVSALPSSQAIYGIVITLLLADIAISTSSAPGIFAIGVLAGLAFMIGGVKQGQCVASAIKLSKAKPEVFGLSLAPAGVVEGFVIFAFALALMVLGNIPVAA